MEKQHAVGAMIGDPTGISYRYLLKDKVFIDTGLDYRLGDRMHVYASYSKIAPKSLLIFGQVTEWFYGLGARVRAKDKDGDTESFIGARGAIGLLYRPESQPFEVFGQVAPTLNVVPATNLDVDANVGLRFVF